MARSKFSPAAPKLMPQLDKWSGVVSAELDLEDVQVHDADFTGVQRLEVEGCTLMVVQLTGVRLAKLNLSDAACVRVEAVGLQANDASLLRTTIKSSRLTGADFGEALLEDCLFEEVKFDETGFRFATLKRVHFANCVLRSADFAGAKLSNVSFSGCELDGADFNGVTCKAVDLRGESLAAIKGVLGLKGATVTSDQLMQLAPLLAAEAGLDVNDET